MRVVFTGISGVSKAHCLDNLAKDLRARGKTVELLSAEGKIRDRGPSDYFSFLDGLAGDDAVRQWSHSFSSALRAWKTVCKETGEPDFSFLSLHLSYHVRSQIFCPLTWRYHVDAPDDITPPRTVRRELVAFLREFEPDRFINLFDNVYSVQKRITKYPFRLIEILRWRNVEELLTDAIADMVIPPAKRDSVREASNNAAKYKFERSQSVAVRHPTSVVRRLVSDIEAKRIYLAYPISEPRRRQLEAGDEVQMRQINHFRRFMTDNFIAFDPVCIDERPLKILWDQHVAQIKKRLKRADIKGAKAIARTLLEGKHEFLLGEANLWPSDAGEYDQMLCGPATAYKSGLSIPADQEVTYTLLADEVRLAVDEKVVSGGSQKGGEVDNQIARRDYRLIDQADCVVIYRPSWNKPSWSDGGTKSEYRYAKATNKPVVVIKDSTDGSFGKPPFDTITVPFDIVEIEGLDGEKVRQSCFESVAAKIHAEIEKRLHP